MSKKSCNFAAMIEKKVWNIWVMAALSLVLTACVPRAVKEAQDVVTKADSMRAEGLMYGREEGDSVQLAQAYETLGQWQWIYPTDYAHACYHYGRLLREKENPVAAMACFINATHSRTRDYHILGRIYSNIGSICHLANEFPLAYDMYEYSANNFLKNGDTLSYYYGLNDMAFELAEQGKKDETLRMLYMIESQCSDVNVLAKIRETKAEAYLSIQQYDSTIYYAKENLSVQTIFLISSVQLAQAYSLIGIKDSAGYYAQKVLDNTNELCTINNALYILTNDDNTKDINYVREKASQRSDVQKLLEIRQGKLSQAVQLLVQDIVQLPNFTWLYAVCITIFIIASFSWIYIRKKRRQHQLLSQQVDELKNLNTIVKQQHEQIMQEQINYKNNLLMAIEHNRNILSHSGTFPRNLSWNDYSAMCAIINNNFGMLANKLQTTYKLSEKEVRLCVLTLFDCSYEQMAEWLIYAPNAIGKYKDRIAKKIGTSAKNLHQFLLELAIGNHI